MARLTAGGSTFNGVHLRMEDDAHFTTVGGGAEVTQSQARALAEGKGSVFTLCCSCDWIGASS